MKYITIKHITQRNVESDYYMIESKADVEMYLTNEHKKAFDDIKRNIISTGDGEEDRYKHPTNIYLKEIFENPAFKLDSTFREKKEKFKQYIAKGYSIIINSGGGYNFLDEKHHEILHSIEIDEMPSEKKEYLKENSKRLVFENDPMLDKYTIKYFEQRGEEISYVINLREFYKDELEEVCKSFIKSGGETLFIYTTGGDVQQMYDYTKTAAKSGIKDFEFIFASGMTKGIETFLIDLNKQNVSVKVLENKQLNTSSKKIKKSKIKEPL